ncbi:hypothetical protein Bca52824_018306 [Brassica carinata]|uniref:F-box domain-containing protein n=1 Tax=Brassica carinata TaxID=52824 RepID=A0A8X7VPT3_BRACI|nr:hypothetical protein Bca52824_018306 [Brassica carinata]
MSNFNLASLPSSLFHKILSKVAACHLRDFGSARVAFSGFNQIGREEYFYRSADLLNLNNWIDEANALRTFRLRCYQAGNLEAIYMRGGKPKHTLYKMCTVFLHIRQARRRACSHEACSRCRI